MTKTSAAETVFFGALARSDPAERAAYLDEVCGDDADLRRQVDWLLAAHPQVGSFLQEDAVRASPLGGTGVEVSGDAPIDVPITERLGSMIGPYKLLQQIGQGGMGTVFMAEQTHPVQRKVALKVIKAGMDSRQVIARFEAERQALALMDHVNIARVFDAGATENGRPYFVMELVHGVPITRYCDDNHLSPRERLELFVPVCAAIQHAHQKGIIHRDIKPSNVLVTLYDGKPVPKVIDFGIAKATEQKLTERTLFTHYGAMVGTLEYVSPEQAEMSALGVDTRSDVYSLGVLLYELLTGSTPLVHQRVKEAAYADVLRMIKDEEPPRPSARLSDSGEALAAIAAQRHVEPAKLTRLVRGELDWIVMKALEKDRNRRYESASAFAADVRRYLNDEPVQACPPSAGYRLRKFARRNKRALATAGLLGVMLLVAVGAVVASALWAADQAKARLVVEETAKKELEHNLYFKDVALAEREQAVANWGRAEELLDGCPEHLRDWEWHYLKRVRQAPPLTLPLDERQIGGTGFGLDFSPDGRLLAAPCGGHCVKVWDLATREEMLVLRGHKGRVIRVVFSPDGRSLASAGEDQTVKVWDVATGALDVNRLRFNLEGHQATVRGLAFSPNGRYLASTGGDATGDKNWVMLWDTTTGRLLHKFPGAYKRYTYLDVAFSPDSRWLASGSADNNVKVWDVKTRQDVFTLRGHNGPVFRVFFSPSPDGRRLRLASMGNDNGWVKIWDLPTDEPGTSAPGGRVLTPRSSHRPHSGGAWSAAFSPDGQTLAVAGGMADGIVRVHNLATGELIYTLQGHVDRVISVAYSPDGQRLVSAGQDRVVKLWETATGQEVLTLRDHKDITCMVRFSPDGRRLASVSVEGTLKVWDATPLEAAGQPHTLALRGHADVVHDVKFSPPDGLRLASASADKTVKVWDAVTGQEILTFDKHVDKVLCVAFSPDGQRLASGGLDRVLRLWDSTTGKVIHTQTEFTGPVRNLAFSPDGTRLATCGGFQEVQVWDTKTWRKVLPPLGHLDFVYGVAFSPDGKHLATASVDMTVKVWNATTGDLVSHLEGHGGRVFSVAFSPKGRLLAASDSDQKVKLWDWAAKTEVRTHSDAHTHYVFSVAFSPDGRYLASASWAEVIIWDLQTGEKLRPRGGLAGAIRRVAFSPDGKRLAVASGYKGKGEIVLWDAPLWENKAADKR